MKLLLAVLVPLLLASAVRVPAGESRPAAGGPFYFAPAPTQECRGVTDCVARIGPWVPVPGHAEATYLLGCQTLTSYLVGGTDARVSDPNVRVWFDGTLGAPVGRTGSGGAFLLFHAVNPDGGVAAFQPILGCVSLKQKNKVSTVAYHVPGRPSATADIHWRTARVRLFKQHGYTYSARFGVGCPAGERIEQAWGAVAWSSSTPPDESILSSVVVHTRTVGRSVFARIQQSTVSETPPNAAAQYGAVCVR